MFITCKACDGSGEGVYGHSWTNCPVCNGAGQVFEPVLVDPIEIPKASRARSVLRARQLDVLHTDTDPTGVFPDPSYKNREPVAA